MITITSIKSQAYYYRMAFILAIITIVYNIAEGILATYMGYEDESLTLFGFGVDSFIEVISGLGIASMILRIWKNPHSNRDHFERTSLRITGTAFYILVGGLSVTAIYKLYTGETPETTLWGLIISSVSIMIMLAMIWGKGTAGRALKSEAILADNECTKVCIYMSVILLISSGVYELTHFAYADIIGTAGLAYFSYREGKECFEKAKSDKLCGCEH